VTKTGISWNGGNSPYSTDDICMYIMKWHHPSLRLTKRAHVTDSKPLQGRGRRINRSDGSASIKNAPPNTLSVGWVFKRAPISCRQKLHDLARSYQEVPPIFIAGGIPCTDSQEACGQHSKGGRDQATIPPLSGHANVCLEPHANCTTAR